MSMTIGQNFSIVGYDIVASAVCDHGTVLVLNNNSSHYLLAETESGGEDLDAQGKHTVLYNPQARLAGSFPYSGERGSAPQAYAAALAALLQVALDNTSDDDGSPDADDYAAALDGDDAPACPPDSTLPRCSVGGCGKAAQYEVGGRRVCEGHVRSVPDDDGTGATPLLPPQGGAR